MWGGGSLKLLRSRTTAIPALYGGAVSLIAEYAHELAIIRAIPMVSAAQAHEYKVCWGLFIIKYQKTLMIH